jgi:hypothetical protein
MSDKQRKVAMVHVNVRLPVYVLEYFQQYPNYTKSIRKVLEQHVHEAQDEEDLPTT